MTTLSGKAKNLIRRFEEAVKEHDWIGAAPPEEWDVIINRYGKAKGALATYIYSLEQKNDNPN